MNESFHGSPRMAQNYKNWKVHLKCVSYDRFSVPQAKPFFRVPFGGYFPGGPGVGTPPFHRRGHGLIPGWETTTPHAMGLGQKINESF